MKVLVVDDMAAMRHVMMNMLRHVGFKQLDEAVDGFQALGMLKNNQYDLVITDLNMPKMDGQQLLKSIRNDQSLKDTPVIMVTCENDKQKVQQALLEKVSGFILKPFNLQTLEKQLSRLREAV
ncbi:two-component system response regulator [Pseudoalteromonas phenolica]|uniref:Two-component system response regulator n=1 Tax=Pseudoalteromonas phenolica TaxID=161398 RepID=A0A4Q7IQQ9_9GAMM|nr:response regulator [Pseudoalteromonas phenolica]RZQ53909.1 two-component system response regulator [Pseudoalteromonas phenolica]